MYSKHYADLQQPKQKIDYSEIIEGFDKKTERTLYAIALIALVLAVAVAMWRHGQQVDKNFIQVYSKPIENHRISPRIDTGAMIQNTINQ